MARIHSGPNGTFSGKVGSVVGASWKGIAYIRAMPRIDKNRKRAGAEKTNNNKFAFCSKLFAPLKPVLSIGLANYPGPMTWLNAACKLNHVLIVAGEGGFEVDFPNLQISYGQLAPLADVMVFREGDELRVTWKNIAGHHTDQVVLLAYDPVNSRCDAVMGTVLRVQESCTLTWAHASMVHVYVFAANQTRTSTSATQYLGMVAFG